MIRAPLAQHIIMSSDIEFRMAASLADFEFFPAACGGTGVIIMLVVGVPADITPSVYT